VLAVGYLAAFVGALAAIEVLGAEEVSPAVPALVAFLLALGVHPAAVRLRGTMDQMLFGDRPDPWEAASTAVSAIGDDPHAALGAIREAMALPYLAIEGRDGVLVESGSPGPHVRRLQLESSHGTQSELVVGLRPGDLRLPDGDARALALVAPLVVALVHAEELARRLQSSRRETVEMVADERLRLRRELHDGLGPLLTGIAFATDAARNTLHSDPDQADATLAQARGDVADAIALIRSVVYGMRPPALDEVGLVSALQQQALTLRRADGSPLPTDFTVEGSLSPLPAAVEVATYRIVVEGLTNVARHVPHATAAVRLGLTGDALTLEVRDNGTAVGEWQAGVGLASMRERAAELGGTVSWGPDETGGLICAVLPLGTATR
jgi:signal transduction histidine kinase